MSLGRIGNLVLVEGGGVQLERRALSGSRRPAKHSDTRTLARPAAANASSHIRAFELSIGFRHSAAGCCLQGWLRVQYCSRLLLLAEVLF